MKTLLLMHAYPDDRCSATGGVMRRAHQHPTPLCLSEERARKGDGHAKG
jgi:hypothetical protein